MQEYGTNLSNDPVRVQSITMALEGGAAEWIVALHDDDAMKLRNFDRFMAALRKWFEHLLAERNVRI